MSETQLVIGMGEVGRALATVLDCPGRDLTDDGQSERADVLHIAYPWHDAFTETTRAYQRRYRTGLVVVHSTVPVGTCDPDGWVHSPVRGRHPRLAEGLKAFPKVFGSRNPDKALRAALLWPYEAVCVPDARHSEAAKLWELAQFGLQVRITQAIYEWCETRGLDPDIVYRRFADDYNTGYQALGDARFTRPILDHVPGPIGGHCVAENAAHLDHAIARVVEYGWH